VASRVERLTGSIDVEPDARFASVSQSHSSELGRVRIYEARMHAKPIGELARIHERESRRTLATQELDCAAGHGLYIFGAQRHRHTKLAK
jgi:hypothetical protein